MGELRSSEQRWSGFIGFGDPQVGSVTRSQTFCQDRPGNSMDRGSTVISGGFLE